MSQRTSRREFLKSSGALTLAGSVPLLWGRRSRAAGSPNEKFGVAVIGVGGMGGYAMDQSLRERCVAICDIDDKKIAEGLKKHGERAAATPAPKVYYDYRKMLDDMKDDIDVVLISTPDHHHAPAAIRAIRLGMAVFAQKPLAHNIRECAELAKAAKEHNVLTQMGNQGHCSESFRRACEYIWDGAVGNITETHSILGRNFGGTGGRPASKPVPEGLHWDEWVGPAPYRDYHDGLHTFGWRNWRDFGTGTIGDMACHNVDCVFFALKVHEAKTYTMECLSTNGGSQEMWAQNNIVRYDIPARGDMPPVKIHVYDQKSQLGELVKEVEGANEGLKLNEDTIYIGDKGMFLTGGHASRAFILPMAKHGEYPQPAKTLPRAHGGPIEDLYWCLRNNGTPASNFPDAAAPLTSFVLSGHLAQYAGVGQKVEWDVEKMECTNLPELNKYVGRTYREGWEV